MSDAAGTARVMTPLELFGSRIKRALVRIGRKLPRLVWYDDEVDVTVTFTADQLPVGLSNHDDALRELFGGPIAEIESQLRRLGVEFDKGVGFSGRDWEWDWSLRGPISVRFRSRAKNPECRLRASPPDKGQTE